MSINDVSAVASLEITEFEDMTDIQQNMYLTDELYNSIVSGSKYSGENDNEDIPSKFYVKPKKTTMYSDIIEKMTASPGSSSEFNFTMNEKMDFINYVYMYKKFPGIKVKNSMKDHVQISWVHNLGHNAIDSFELVIDGDPKQTITNTWLDIYAQYFISKDHRKNYRKNIGDEKYSRAWTNGITEEPAGKKVWGNELLPFSVKVPLPFSFNKTPFPIFLGLQSKILIRGRFKTKLSQLIKMRVKEGEKWKEAKFDWRVLEGISGEDHVLTDQPELYACYSKITKDEKRFFLESLENSPKENGTKLKKTYRYYYNDIMINTYDKLYTSEEPFSDLLSSKTPTKGIFWVAQNVQGMLYNNYSNYTTDPYDIDNGKHPIVKASMKHSGTASRFKDMDYSHLDDMMSYYKFPSSSYTKGYGAFSFSRNMLSIDSDIGPIFDRTKTVLTLVLGNENEKRERLTDVKDEDVLKSILDRSEDKSKSADKYRIFILTVVVKQFQFSIADKIKVNDGS